MASLLIITPFYNSYEYFEITYRSVLDQTFKDYEWVIVDDNSEDAQCIK